MSRPGLAVRLFMGQLLVVAAGVVAAGLSAVAVGPSVFRAHLGQDVSVPGGVRHAELAFRNAGAISLGLALLAALVVAAAVSAFVTGRITRPVQALAGAATDVSTGRYDVDLPTPALGAEFDALTDAFGAMAARLRDVEATRRRMLADLAHEMRTPIATLEGYLEGFEDGVASWDAETSAMLRAQTRRLARLAEDIAAVSRTEEGGLDLHLVPVSPARLVEAAVAAAADRYAQRGVRLTAEVAAGLPDLAVDADRIGQVLGNLLDNALRHTDAGGQVRLHAGPSVAGVLLEVTDTGRGIPPEHLPHVFERFYRVDAARGRAHGGSGIGLAIAKALVEAHGGRIGVASRPGSGATFTVTLPAAVPGPARAARGTAVPGAS